MNNIETHAPMKRMKANLILIEMYCKYILVIKFCAGLNSNKTEITDCTVLYLAESIRVCIYIRIIKTLSLLRLSFTSISVTSYLHAVWNHKYCPLIVT